MNAMNVGVADEYTLVMVAEIIITKFKLNKCLNYRKLFRKVMVRDLEMHKSA